MAVTAEDFYRSSNGDRWQLIHDTCQVFVRNILDNLCHFRSTLLDACHSGALTPLHVSLASLGHVEKQFLGGRSGRGVCCRWHRACPRARS